MKVRILKAVILLLSVVGLYDVATCSIVRYPEKYKVQEKYDTPLTEEDVVAFVPVWQEFNDEFGDKVNLSELSLSNKLPAETIPYSAGLWLKSKGWSANRYFYVEQRIYDIMHHIYLRKHSLDIIDVMKKSLATETDTAARENINNIITAQEEILNNLSISPGEMEAVETHYAEILQLMDE